MVDKADVNTDEAAVDKEGMTMLDTEYLVAEPVEMSGAVFADVESKTDDVGM